jgi:hypothetical protein
MILRLGTACARVTALYFTFLLSTHFLFLFEFIGRDDAVPGSQRRMLRSQSVSLKAGIEHCRLLKEESALPPIAA